MDCRNRPSYTAPQVYDERVYGSLFARSEAWPKVGRGRTEAAGAAPRPGRAQIKPQHHHTTLSLKYYLSAIDINSDYTFSINLWLTKLFLIIHGRAQRSEAPNGFVPPGRRQIQDLSFRTDQYEIFFGVLHTCLTGCKAYICFKNFKNTDETETWRELFG